MSNSANKPTPKNFPREALLDELGRDARVDSKTMGELDELNRRSGEPVDSRYDLGAVLANPSAYSKQSGYQEDAITLPSVDDTQHATYDEGVDEAQLPETQDTPDGDSQPSGDLSIQDQFEAYKAQVEAELDVRNKALDLALSRAQQPATPAPQQVEDEEPAFMQLTPQQLHQMAETDPFYAQFIAQQQQTYMIQKQVAAMQAHMDKERADHIGRRFDDAYEAFKKQNPDVDNYIPKDLLDKARKMSVDSRNVNADFASWLEMAYWRQAGPAERKARSASADELNVKRESKRQESIKKTAVVSGGGQAFQAPATKSNDRSMRGGRNDMLEDLKRLGVR